VSGAIPADLAAATRLELAALELPDRAASLYPVLHAAAARVARRTGAGYADAVGAVFREACAAVGARYQGQNMAQALAAAHLDGRLAAALRSLTPAAA
jgi:hypothetical protein